MSRELFWLTLTIAMTGLMWVPYILDRMQAWGLWDTLDNPKPTNPPQSPWAVRMMAAHSNAVENLVLFAPLALTAHVLGLHTSLTAGACATYFWARLAHYVAYTLGIPVVRTLAFTVAWLATGALVLAVLKVV